MIRFYRTNGQNDDVWRYAMEIDGEVIARDLTIDQVVEAINRRDEERLGWAHAPKRTDCHAGAAAPARNDSRDGGGRGGHDPV